MQTNPFRAEEATFYLRTVHDCQCTITSYTLHTLQAHLKLNEYTEL